jgi:hypothetical protein
MSSYTIKNTLFLLIFNNALKLTNNGQVIPAAKHMAKL